MTRRASPERSITRAAVELIAVAVAVTKGCPRVLTIENGAALPSGPFETRHRSLQMGVRTWVERQTRQPLGYVEQLYTFADSDRDHLAAGGPGHLDQLPRAHAGNDVRRSRGDRLARLVRVLSVGG